MYVLARGYGIQLLASLGCFGSLHHDFLVLCQLQLIPLQGIHRHSIPGFCCSHTGHGIAFIKCAAYHIVLLANTCHMGLCLTDQCSRFQTALSHCLGTSATSVRCLWVTTTRSSAYSITSGSKGSWRNFEGNAPDS